MAFSRDIEREDKSVNVLFMSLGRYRSINDREIYTDLLREFIKHGHFVYIVSPTDTVEDKNVYTID